MQQKVDKEDILGRVTRFALHHRRIGVIGASVLCLGLAASLLGLTRGQSLAHGLATGWILISLAPLVFLFQTWSRVGASFRQGDNMPLQDAITLEIDVARRFSELLQFFRIGMSITIVAAVLVLAGDVFVTDIPAYLLGLALGISVISIVLLCTCLIYQLRTALYQHELSKLSD